MGRNLVARFYTFGLDEFASAFDTFRIPGTRKQHQKVIDEFHREANKVRKKVGLKPKKYRKVVNRKIVEYTP